MPNHKGSIPFCSTIGMMIDVVNTTTDIPSKKHPRIIKNTVKAANNCRLDRSKDPIHEAKFLGIPVKPIDTDKKAAPVRMKAIIQDVTVAPIRLSFNMLIERDLFDHASMTEKTTPTAAASVGDAIPM